MAYKNCKKRKHFIYPIAFAVLLQLAKTLKDSQRIEHHIHSSYPYTVRRHRMSFFIVRRVQSVQFL